MEEELREARWGRVQRTRMRNSGFTAARRKLFIDTLAATGNVAAAMRAIGTKSSMVYRHRRDDPAFAAAWKDALAIGYERLEEELLRRALEAVAIDIDPDAVPVPGLPPLAQAEAEEAAKRAAGSDVGGAVRPAGAGAALPVAYRLALSLLARRDAAVRKGAGRTDRRMTTQEVNALLARKLDVLAASRARGRAEAEAEAGAGGASADGDGEGA